MKVFYQEAFLSFILHQMVKFGIRLVLLEQKEKLSILFNNSYIEIGGHSDGQSFGNTFLDAEVKSLEIITSEKKEKYTSIRKKK